MHSSNDLRMSDQNREHLRRLHDLIELCDQLGPGTHITHVMALIWVAQEKNLTISDLARRSGRTLAGTSRHIQRLRKPPGSSPDARGFVSIGGDSDARLKRLRLSKRGREWISAALSALSKTEC